MSRVTRFALACVLVGCSTERRTESPSPAPTTHADLAIVGANVFDGSQWIDDATVLVTGGKVTAFGPGIAVPADAQVVAAEHHSLLPGFIDAHAHVNSPRDLTQALVFGVTTEIDMFTSLELLAALAAPADATRADMVSAGTLATAPGGHGTEYGIEIPTVATAADALAFVQARKAEGSRFLKIVYDDGSAFGLRVATIDRPTLVALVAAAHSEGMIAVVHIGSQQGALDAIAAGADGLAHIFSDAPASPEFVAAANQAGIFVTDTMAVTRSVCGLDHDGLAGDPRVGPWLPPAVLQNLRTPMFVPKRPDCDNAMQAIAALHHAGVAILASTDAPNPGTAHGVTVHEELALLVEAGLSPTEALRAATSSVAKAFSLADRGVIAEGARADLVLVEGDPREDITHTRAIAGVWKGGVAVDREAWKADVAAAVAALERAKQAPPPSGFGDGKIADFGDGKLATSFGAGWQVSTDAIRGGQSTATMKVVRVGKNPGLRVQGNLDGDAPIPFAGVIFFPGEAPMQPANLTSKPVLAFRAKADAPMAVMVFAAHTGLQPAATVLPAVPKGSELRVDLRTLVPELYDVTGIYFGSAAGAGPFTFTLDDVRLE